LDYDVIVAGGGPIGCFAARDIAEQGCRVLVLEEHREIGEPVQCSGLISERVLEISRVSNNVVLNKLKGAVVHAPDKNILNLKGDRVYGVVVDRGAFDRDIARQAAKAGAKIYRGKKLISFDYLTDKLIVNTTSGEDKGCAFTCKLLIGADGFNSTVARLLDLAPAQEKVTLFAAEVSLPGFDGHLAHIFLDHQLAPGWFGWLMPVRENIARAGIGCSPLMNHDWRGSPRPMFEKLIAKYPIFKGLEILKTTGGIVPIGYLERTYDTRVLLAGDAAAQVKPISGGGLYLGLKGASFCAATAIKALQKNDFSRAFLKTYQDAWDEDFGLEIKCGLKHREIFLNMDNREIESLTGFLNKPHWRNIILKYGDLDYHSRLAAKLSLAPPWANRFLENGLKALLRGLAQAAECRY